MTSHINNSVRGIFINLKGSEYRRQKCIDFLSEHSLSGIYSRFEGILGSDHHHKFSASGLSPGKIGCWLSHINAIKENIDSDFHLHVLEDDFELTSAFPQFILNFEEHIKDVGDWDIIFTDFSLAINRHVYDIKNFIHDVNRLQASNKIQIRDATKLYAAGNSSYIVNIHSKEKIFNILNNGMGSPLPQDLYLRECARRGEIKIFVTLPFLTTLNDTFMDSDILGNIDDRNPSIINNVLFRRSLSWGADTSAILKTIKQRIAAQPPIDNRAMIYTHLVAHILSDEYQNY